jgi:hypothetical protein
MGNTGGLAFSNLAFSKSQRAVGKINVVRS